MIDFWCAWRCELSKFIARGEGPVIGAAPFCVRKSRGARRLSIQNVKQCLMRAAGCYIRGENNRSVMKSVVLFYFILVVGALNAQLVVNEGSNKNFNSILDEDDESEDWIEIYNAGNAAVNLEGYSLSDDELDLQKWTFSAYEIQPGEFLIVFCSGKDRQINQVFESVALIENYTPEPGWNSHDFGAPFEWDGSSNILVDVCSYYNQGYTSNSIFNQTATTFPSTLVKYNDNSDASCDAFGGDVYYQRPNTRFNTSIVGDDNIQNCNTCYPAPYGNWYWSARNQMLFTADELLTAGLSAGPISNMAWDVESTASENYTYISIKIKHTLNDEVSTEFVNDNGVEFHANFKIDSQGETVYLSSPAQEILDQLYVDCPSTLTSLGSLPDGSLSSDVLTLPSPGASNGNSTHPEGICSAPLISEIGGVYNTTLSVEIFNTGDADTQIRFTTNGDEPNQDSEIYLGEAIEIYQSSSIRARAFKDNFVPSSIASESYLLNVSHITPILSIQVDNSSLYGEEGIFDHWGEDWERFAQITFYDSTSAHEFVFDRDAAMQIDGGAGGSRSHPQHSFRLELAKSAFEETPVQWSLLSNRQERDTYSRLYFRNGSNQWLTLPYKDAYLVDALTSGTHCYHSAMRPVSVYINGGYFGLYEMREKLDGEFWEEYDNFQDPESVDVISVSYWYDLVLRATQGQAQDYLNSWEDFQSLDPASEDFILEANAIYDLENYSDYIISQGWIGNFDWPYNNIKAYRSDASDLRWRFATIDLELSLQPNGWSGCQDNGLDHILGQGENNLFVGAWNRSMDNEEYRVYFINRFADLNNTLYRSQRLLSIEQNYFNEWVLEMQQEYQRWGNPNEVAQEMDGFYDRHNLLRDDIECKAGVIQDQIQDALELDGQFDVLLDVYPENAGVIHLNTITPTDYPWDGVYYKGIPIELTAEANPGYNFVLWGIDSDVDDQMNPFWTGETYSSELSFTAVFEVTNEVEEIDTNTLVDVYPNPAKDILHIRTSSNRIRGWQIYNHQGQVVEVTANHALDTHVALNVSQLAPGIYTLSTSTDSGVEVNRWVKF